MMVKDAFDRWWEWVEKPADSTLTIPLTFMKQSRGYCQNSATTAPR
jgi:hypothetical protein